MLYSIRKGVWETNSSSIHTLNICNDDIQIPKDKIIFGKLDWKNWDEMYVNNVWGNFSVQGKIEIINSYLLYQPAYIFLRLKEKVIQALKKRGIESEFIIPKNINESDLIDLYEYFDLIGELLEEPIDEMGLDMLHFIYNPESKISVIDRDWYYMHGLENKYKEGYKNFMIGE